MWLFLSDAFVSVVQHRDHEDTVIVRARTREDLERVILPERSTLLARLAIQETPDADYRWRVQMAKRTWSEVLSWHAMNVTAANFKDSIAPGDKLRKRAYSDVWRVMAGAFGCFGRKESSLQRVDPNVFMDGWDPDVEEFLRG